MSADSLNLTDFFNNDESDGLRLAEFLQKRRGVGQRPNYVFMNCEMQRLSLEVQLEKLPPSQLEETCKNKKEHLETEKPHDGNEVTLQLKDINANNQEDKADETLSLNTKGRCSTEVTEVNTDPGLPFQPVSPISPAINQISDLVVNPSQPSNSLKPTSSRSISCRLTSIRKNGGGASPGDRLRLYSLRQLSKHCSGKRTLLKEFESAIENTNFQPSSCSTPLSKPQANSPAKNDSVNGSCCNHTDTLVRTLKEKDDELKKFMESILENTLKQVKSHEKENNDCTKNDKSTKNSYAPKQPLNQINAIGSDTIDQHNLSLNKRNPEQCLRHSSLLELKKRSQPSLSKLMKTQRNSSAQNPGSVHRLNKSSSHIDSRSNPTDSLFSARLSISRSVGDQQESRSSITNNARLELQNTPPQKNVTIVLPSQNVEIPARQNVNENSIKIISDNPNALVFVPVNQTFNKICHAETVNNKTALNDTTKQSEIQLPTLSAQLAPLPSTTNDVQCYQMAEDNLKLTDILTDDENPIPTASTSQNVEENGQIPLNLAPSSTNIRRKKLTLNKAPGIPINGEKFAQELERMSHYEILDLRKRNSIGQVFGISGRQNRHSRDEAFEKQRKLDEQIERELLKRNINKIIEKRPTQCNDANVDVENLLEADNSPTEQKVPNVSEESSLLGEMPSDRVSFKTANHSERVNKTNKKQQSQLLKQYLALSKHLLSQKKRRTSFNKSKRSLYREVYPQSEVANNSAYLPSPRKSDRNRMSILKIVSPPPPAIQQDQLTINEVEKSSHETPSAVVDIEDLPRPPPGFENSLEAISNISNNHSTTNNTFQSEKVISKTATNINTNHNAGNEEQLFQKPQQPAPKRGHKRKKDATHFDLLQLSNESRQSAYNDDVSTENTLRRSRRGHMAFKHPLSTFQPLFQKTFNSRLQLRKKQEERTYSKTNKKNSKSDLAKVTKARQEPKQVSTASKNYPLIASSSQDVTTPMNKRVKKIEESKALKKKMKNHKEIIQSDDNLGCSRSPLTTPPPDDHINHVFDELKNGITTRSKQSQMTLLPPQKVKPLKVRVARLKSSTHPMGCSSVNTVTSSSTTGNSSQDFISWLKNISESNFSITYNNEIFKEIKLSPACSLSFTELKGLEYAFYDTDENAFLGYLRFQPHQKKPRRRSKYFNLHFISIVGNFRITANGKDSRVAVGDMFVIQKLVYYDIENISDDIGVLMVIKNH